MPGFRERFRAERPLIGVIHLPALPGYAASPGMEAVVAHALAELAAYRVGGLDGVLVENENDQPHRVAAASETVAAMTRVTHALTTAADGLPVGIEILLNDPEASLAVAHAAGADFIRTDYFADEMRREGYGIMRAAPAEVVAFRERIGAGRVLILADIQVKYAEMIAPRTLAASAREAATAGADAVVVTGGRTGEPPSAREVLDARDGAGDCPVLVGSGLAADNTRALLEVADGAIVGTSLMRDGTAAFERIAALTSARP